MNIEKLVLEKLKENGRLSDAEIAVELSSSDAVIKKARRSLEKKGVILGYSTIVDAQIDPTKETIRALVELTVRPQKRTGYDAIAKRIYKYPNVVGHYLISGQYDFMVIVEGGSHQEIAAFVFDKLATIEHVTHTNTHFVFKKYKEYGFILEKEERVERVPIVV
jgi:DNA-binding Lrp family transcriptional regulator